MSSTLNSKLVPLPQQPNIIATPTAQSRQQLNQSNFQTIYALTKAVNDQAATAANSSSNQNGYVDLGNNLLLQWATGTVDDDPNTDYQTISFPKAFSSAVYAVLVSTVVIDPPDPTDSDLVIYQIYNPPSTSSADLLTKVGIRRGRAGQYQANTKSQPTIIAIGT